MGIDATQIMLSGGRSMLVTEATSELNEIMNKINRDYGNDECRAYITTSPNMVKILCVIVPNDLISKIEKELNIHEPKKVNLQYREKNYD